MVGATEPNTAPIGMGATQGAGVWWASPATFTVAAETQSIDITWGDEAALNEEVGDDYKLWVIVTDAETGCFNYRYLGIDPRTNAFDAEITVVGLADASATGLSLSTDNLDGGNACIALSQLIAYEFNTEATVDDGETYAYFRIALNDPSPSSYSWDFSASFTGFAAENAIEYSTDGTTWNAYTETAVNTVPNTDLEVYIRVRTDASTAAQGITAVISDLQLGTFGALVPDTDTGNNTKTYTINQIPTVGEFTGF
ncbi:MAG: hypothetical protein HOA90_22545 [Prolixibacteraceae bacterium]|nr:hypothetical protein [Prolixibacteraceae bacterium]